MKFYRYILIIFILITAFSCKKTTLTITSPGPDFFLGKMQSGNWDKVKVDGNKLTIDGKEYTFEDQILGVGGVYKGGDKGYIVAVPGGDNLYTVEMDEKAKESIDEIMNIVGEENVTGVMKDLIDSGGDPSKVNVDKIASTARVSEEEKKRLEDLFGKLDGSNFGNPNTIGPAKS